MFLIFFCIGALSISVMLCVITDSHDFYKLNNYSLFVFLNVVPYFWLMLSVVFLGVAYVNSRNIENGYKYLNVKNVIATISMCIFFGIILHSFGIASIIEHHIASNSSIYNNFIYNRKKVFNHPENGMLSGQIIDFTITLDKQELTIEDINEKIWKIIITKDTLFRSEIDIKNGIFINVSGKISNENNFIANVIKEIPECCASKLQHE